MTHQAQTRIKEYYTKLRNVYHNIEDQDKTMPITPRQLESIIRLAEANAKMYLSDSVDLKHAESAIELMDLFLNVTLGGDVDFAFFGLDAEQRRKETDPRTALLEILANGFSNFKNTGSSLAASCSNHFLDNFRKFQVY